MNIAYLVLAHDQPNLLMRLIERLDQQNVSFFIHVDKKNKSMMPLLQQHFKGNRRVHIITTQKIYWMGFNMVKATIQLLQLAHSSAIDFKYYVLLSGRDYPIKSNAFINYFFDSHSCDFISYNAIEHLPESFGNKVGYYHFMDNPYYNPRSPQKMPLLVKMYYGAHKHLDKYLPKRKFYKNYRPYFGSQWFALTHETVTYILSFLKEHKDYIQFMKLTEGPDEMFFQTIIMNTERKNNVTDYKRYTEWAKNHQKEDGVFVHQYSSLRYMDWSERGKPKPAVLDMSYCSELMSTKEIFARKFDQQLSSELLTAIDAQLLRVADHQ